MNTKETLTRVGVAATFLGAGYFMSPRPVEASPSQSDIDPGKTVVDFEPKAGTKALISGRWAECIVMGDTNIEIDGQWLDTKDGYKGNPKVGSLTRVYNKNFRIELEKNLMI